MDIYFNPFPSHPVASRRNAQAENDQRAHSNCCSICWWKSRVFCQYWHRCTYSFSSALIYLASTLSTVIQTIASTSFNEAAETADIHCSQQRLKWCVRTDSTDPFTWYEGCVVSGELDGKPFPAPPGKVKARVEANKSFAESSLILLITSRRVCGVGSQ